MTPCDLSCAGYYRWLPPRTDIYNSEVPPSALGQTSTPFFHGSIAGRIIAVPGIKGTRDKTFFGGLPDHGVGKDHSRIFAPGSSTPFDKIAKDGFSTFQRCLDSTVIIAVFSVRGQIDVINCSKFYSLVFLVMLLLSFQS